VRNSRRSRRSSPVRALTLDTRPAPAPTCRPLRGAPVARRRTLGRAARPRRAPRRRGRRCHHCPRARARPDRVDEPPPPDPRSRRRRREPRPHRRDLRSDVLQLRHDRREAGGIRDDSGVLGIVGVLDLELGRGHDQPPLLTPGGEPRGRHSVRGWLSTVMRSPTIASVQSLIPIPSTVSVKAPSLVPSVYLSAHPPAHPSAVCASILSPAEFARAFILPITSIRYDRPNASRGARWSRSRRRRGARGLAVPTPSSRVATRGAIRNRSTGRTRSR